MQERSRSRGHRLVGGGGGGGARNYCEGKNPSTKLFYALGILLFLLFCTLTIALPITAFVMEDYVGKISHSGMHTKDWVVFSLVVASLMLGTIVIGRLMFEKRDSIRSSAVKIGSSIANMSTRFGNRSGSGAVDTRQDSDSSFGQL